MEGLKVRDAVKTIEAIRSPAHHFDIRRRQKRDLGTLQTRDQNLFK